jgi:hypothetical protein
MVLFADFAVAMQFTSREALIYSIENAPTTLA